MQKFVFILISSILLTSCSMMSKNNYREVANFKNPETWKVFIQQVSSKTQMSEESIEQAMIRYFQKKPSSSSSGNHSLLGITDDQAQRIKSLSDDMPYMNKVRQWGIENMDQIFPKVDKSIFAKAYDDVIVAGRGVSNKYLVTVQNTGRRSQRKASPHRSLDTKQQQILDDIQSIKSTEIKDTINKTFAELKKKGKDTPELMANGQVIVESASLISRKTGLNAMGDGCPVFIENVSLKVLGAKADVDKLTAEIVEQMAYQKNNGRVFASIDDVPVDLRLGADDILAARKEAFIRTFGYDDVEALKAISRLSKKPCRIY